jgi:hypothetical protein
VAAAQVDSQSLVVIGVPGGGAVVGAQIYMPMTVTGQVVVSFRGDPSSGCGAIGVCSYTGTVIWSPAGTGSLQIAKILSHKEISYVVFNSFGNGPTAETASARVQRTIAGRLAGSCADAEPQPGPSFITEHRGRFTFDLFERGGTVLATRCAGPIDDDLVAVGPRATLAVNGLISGDREIDLREQRSFAGHGFAGTMTSTVVLRLGKPRERNGGGNSIPQGVPRTRERTVTERLSVGQVRGGVTESFRGTSDTDVCALLDSCGASGTIALRPTPRAPEASLYAIGSAKLPYSDFLVALGLRRGPLAKGIHLYGQVDWTDAGTAREQFSQSGLCSDATRLQQGSVSIEARGGSLTASYAPGSVVDTRCPRPSTPRQYVSVLSGAAPLSRLAGGTFTLRLRRGSAITDDGYSGRTSGDLSITLRRGRVTQQVFTEPQ